MATIIHYLAYVRLPTEKAHGIQIVNTCRAIADLNIEVHLVIPCRLNSIRESIFDYYCIPPIFYIKKFFTVDLFAFQKILGPWAYYIGMLSFYFGVFLIYICKYSRKVIIYSRDPLASLLVFFGYRVVIEVHSLPEKKKKLFRWFLLHASAVIVISEGVRDGLLSLGIKNNHIIIAHDAVDLSKFDIKITQTEARKKLQLNLEEKVILYTGHLYSWKGVDVLAEAGNLLSDIHRVYFVGGTERDIDAFSNRHKDLINRGRIVIIGNRPHQEIPLWLKAADVLVLPTSSQNILATHFTSPLKLFEYMASKRPIIAADLPSTKAILSSKEALFFESGNVTDLAEKMLYCLAHEEEASLLSHLSHERSLDFSWQKRAEKIVKVLIQL